MRAMRGDNKVGGQGTMSGRLNRFREVSTTPPFCAIDESSLVGNDQSSYKGPPVVLLNCPPWVGTRPIVAECGEQLLLLLFIITTWPPKRNNLLLRIMLTGHGSRDAKRCRETTYAATMNAETISF
jgi:hypothetical protein